MRKYLFIFCMFCASILNASSKYEIKSLDFEVMEDVVCSEATCINNRSEISGGVFFGGINMRHSAFLWTKETGLVELFANKAFPPNDINDLTQIVGSIPKESGPPSGYLWSLGNDFINLEQFKPTGINNDGVMTGHRVPTKLAHIQYPDKSYKCLDLKIISNLKLFYKIYNYSEHPHAINNKSEVIGQVIFKADKLMIQRSNPKIYSHGFLWLGKEKEINFGENKIPTAINDLSQVILVSDFSEKGTSWLWEDGRLIELWKHGLAKAINNFDVVVGNQQGDAVIWENGEVRKLLDLTDSENWTKLNIAMDINDVGEIVGWGTCGGKRTAFLLIPKA